MMTCPEVVLERVTAALGEVTLDNSTTVKPEVIAATGFATRRIVSPGTTLEDLMLRAATACVDSSALKDRLAGVIVATSTGANRFPSIAVRIASALGLPAETAAFDIQMACSAYPYAVYLAGRFAADSNRAILVVNGDVQSSFLNGAEPGTAALFSDAATATIVSSGHGELSAAAFYSRASDALTCSATGPIQMDGFKVFAFAATDVVKFLRPFGTSYDHFIPHQANMYMVRQLAKALGVEDKLLTCGSEFANPGSCSIPLALAAHPTQGRALLAGFGAGFSAAALLVRLAENFEGQILP
jgi:3-oxoacyl-[acyl-carrier-protein] synthase III